MVVRAHYYCNFCGNMIPILFNATNDHDFIGKALRAANSGIIRPCEYTKDDAVHFCDDCFEGMLRLAKSIQEGRDQR